MPPERVHAAFEGDRAVAGSGVFAFDLTVPGGQVKAAGLTIVGVLPTHRRRGLLGAMMRSQIDAAHARGEPVLVFWPSQDTIYGRFGCGMASMMAEIDLPREHAAAYAASETAGSVRLVPLPEAEPFVTAIYDRVAGETPGMFARSSAWWQDRLLIDPDWRRRGGGALQCAVLDIGGEPAAYAFYRLNAAFEYGSGIGHTLVVEAMGVSPEATHAIWRFLFGIDWMARVKAHLLSLDHPLLLSAAEPRRLNFHLREGIWVRLIDVGAALAARTYASDDAHRRGGRGRILSVERRALARRKRRRDEDRCAGRSRLRGGFVRLCLSRRLQLCGTCPRDAGARASRWCYCACRRTLPHRPQTLVPGDFLVRDPEKWAPVFG